MPDVPRAVAYLEDAEATIMSWWQRLDTEDDDEFTTFSMLAAVLRSVSRAAGALETDDAPSDLLLVKDGAGRIAAITYEGQTFHRRNVTVENEPNVRGPFYRADEYLEENSDPTPT